MIWLAAYGGAGPIGSQKATTTIAGRSWKVFDGYNGSMRVFSFVAADAPVTNFSADAKLFLTYLVNSYGYISSDLYVNSKLRATVTGTKLTSNSAAGRNRAVRRKQRKADRVAILGVGQLDGQKMAMAMDTRCLLCGWRILMDGMGGAVAGEMRGAVKVGSGRVAFFDNSTPQPTRSASFRSA